MSRLSETHSIVVAEPPAVKQRRSDMKEILVYVAVVVIAVAFVGIAVLMSLVQHWGV